MFHPIQNLKVVISALNGTTSLFFHTTEKKKKGKSKQRNRTVELTVILVLPDLQRDRCVLSSAL